MSGRYLSRNEKASVRAAKNNLWIQYMGKFYHPDEFRYRFESGMGVRPEDVKLLNPMPFLREGREIIKGKVRAFAPAASILNALTRLYDFEDKLRKFGFREIEGQVNSVHWPDGESITAGMFDKWEREKRERENKLPDIDWDAIDEPQ